MIYDLVKESRSYRGYDESRKITREELLDMVACARLAPSSINKQPLKYYLVNEEEEVQAIFPLTGWARALPELELPHPGKRPTAYVIICQDLNIVSSIPAYQKDVGIVAQTMLLRAVEMGLGGCMIGSFSPEKVRTVLHLPESIAPVLVVAIGKPDETIVITDIKEDGSINYYRDENDIHYVPKRSLEDLILN